MLQCGHWTLQHVVQRRSFAGWPVADGSFICGLFHRLKGFAKSRYDVPPGVQSCSHRADPLVHLSRPLQVGMVSESVRTIARAFQLNPRDALVVVSLLEVIARDRSFAIAEGINATAVTLVAKEFSDKGDIRATKALAELYNSGGHYGHARDLLARALNASKSSNRIDGKKSNVDPAWTAKCLLMNLAHAGERAPCITASCCCVA